MFSLSVNYSLRTIWLVLLLALLPLTLAGAGGAGAQPSASLVLSSTAGQELVEGQEFTLQVAIAGVEDLLTADLQLSFDPERLQALDNYFTLGNLLAGSGVSVAKNTVSQGEGSLRLVFSALGADAAISGSGIIATIRLRALAPGNTNITLITGPGKTRLIDSTASNYIPYDKTDLQLQIYATRAVPPPEAKFVFDRLGPVYRVTGSGLAGMNGLQVLVYDSASGGTLVGSGLVTGFAVAIDLAGNPENIWLALTGPDKLESERVALATNILLPGAAEGSINYPSGILTHAPTIVQGTASDPGHQLAGVRLELRRLDDGKRLRSDGLWVSSQVWLPAIYNHITGQWQADVSQAFFAGGDYQLRLLADYGDHLTELVTAGFTIDKQPPVITLDSPAPGYLTRAGAVTVTGSSSQVEDIAVLINGVPAELDQEGYFTAIVNLNEGRNPIQALVTDRSNLVFDQTVEVIRDTIRPALRVDSPADQTRLAGREVVVQGSVETGAQVTVGGTAAPVDGGGFSGTVQLVAEGVNTITVVATDQAGNTRTVLLSLYRDSTAELVISQPSDGAITAASSIWLEGLTEPGATVDVQVNNDEPMKVKPSAAGQFKVKVHLAEGGNVITVTVQDLVGNTQANSLVLTRDTTPPALEILEPVDRYRTGADQVTISGQTEAGAQVRSGGQTWPVEATGEWQLVADLAEGQNRVSIEALDFLGNSAQTWLQVTRDTTGPALRVSEPGASSRTNQQTVMVRGQTDAGSSLEINGMAVDVAADGSFADAVDLTDGVNIITVMAWDDLDNLTTVTRSIFLDKNAPLLTLEQPLPGAVLATGTVGVAGQVDKPSTVTVNGVEAAIDVLEFAVDVDLDEGLAPITIIAIDNLGNTAETTIAVTVDLTPPLAQVLTPGDSALLNTRDVLVEVLVADGNDGAGVAPGELELRVDGIRRESFAIRETPAGLIASWMEDGLAEGDHQLSVGARDAAGHLGEAASNFTIDATPPAITYSVDPGQPTGKNGWYNIVPLVTLRSEGGAVINYRLNDNPWQESVTTAAVASGEGVQRLTYRAQDAAVNVSATGSLAFQVDTMAPAAPIVQELPSPTQDFNVSVTGSAEAGATVQLYHAGRLLRQAVASGGNFTFPDIDLQEGENLLQVRAVDQAGNTGAWWSQVVNRDTMGPVLDILVTEGDTDNISIEAMEDLRELPALTINGLPVPVRAAGIDNTSLFLASYDLLVGSYDIRAVGYDELGNRGIGLYVKLDAAAAGQGNVQSELGGVQLAPGTLEGEALFQLAARWFGAGQAAALLGQGLIPASPVMMLDLVNAELAEGATVMIKYIYGIDPERIMVYRWNEDDGQWELVGGDTLADEALISVTLHSFSEYAALADVTPPPLVIDSPADGWWNNNPQLTISGVTEPGASLVIGGQQVPLAGDGSFSHATTLVEGVNSLEFTATDSFGNGTAQSLTVNLDTMAPAINVISPAAEQLTTSKPDLRVTASSEPGALLALLLEDQPVVSTTGGQIDEQLDLAAGEQVIGLQATDTAGNLTTLSYTVTYDSSLAPSPAPAETLFTFDRSSAPYRVLGQGLPAGLVTVYDSADGQLVAAGSVDASGVVTIALDLKPSAVWVTFTATGQAESERVGIVTKINEPQSVPPPATYLVYDASGPPPQLIGSNLNAFEGGLVRVYADQVGTQLLGQAIIAAGAVAVPLTGEPPSLWASLQQGGQLESETVAVTQLLLPPTPSPPAQLLVYDLTGVTPEVKGSGLAAYAGNTVKLYQGELGPLLAQQVITGDTLAIVLPCGPSEVWFTLQAPGKSESERVRINTQAASANADLSGLTLSQGNLSPGFTAGTTSYTAGVANSVSSITVITTVADNTATVTVNGIAVSSGQASGAINLNVGANTITVVVTAQDGTTKTYTITVNVITPPPGAVDGDYTSPPATVRSVQLVQLHADRSLDLVSNVGNLHITIPATSIAADQILAVEPGLPPERGNIQEPVYSLSVTLGLAGPVRVGIPVDDPANAGRLALWYWNEQREQWVCTGGAISAGQDEFAAQLHRPGLFTFRAIDDEVDFTDMEGHWAEQEVRLLAANRIVLGYPDHQFIPGGTITRNEMIVLLSRVLGLDPVDDAPLPWTDAGSIPAWASPYVTAAWQAGLVAGYEDETYRGEQSISRAEVVAILIRALGDEFSRGEVDLDRYLDATAIPAWSRSAVAVASKLELVTGYPDGSFGPERTTTRAEAALLYWRLLGLTGVVPF